MSRIEKRECEVQSLNPDELKAFRDWFAQFEAQSWDSQIEEDARSGKLQKSAQRALRDHQESRSTVL